MFKVLRAKMMDFGDALKKGIVWGFCVGLVLSISIILSGNTGITEPISVFVYVAFMTVFVTGLSIFLGCILALIILGIKGNLEFFNWFLCFLAGSLLSIYTTLISGLISGMLGWGVSILLAIVFLLRKYLAEKLPQWIEQAIDNAMVVFLTSIFITGLTFVFQHFTGITLRVV